MTLAGTVRAKKRELDALRLAIRTGALDALDRSQRIDITFTSNAIEGNTLTAGETALVIEKGITIAGKPLKDHLEAIDHARALDWVIGIAAHPGRPFREGDIRDLHRLVVASSAPEIAGRYADGGRYVNTDAGVFHFPAPVEVPALMADFGRWLAQAEAVPETAFAAHTRLVAIHPFNDGNGRTARLLMNLLLMRGGYPAVAVRPEDRAAYIAALERGQEAGDHADIDGLLFERLDGTLDMYLAAAAQARHHASGPAGSSGLRSA